MEYLPDFVQFKPCVATPLKEIFIAASGDLLDLLHGMLTFDPLQRLTAPAVSEAKISKTSLLFA